LEQAWLRARTTSEEMKKDLERSHSRSFYHVIARITVSGPSERLLRTVAQNSKIATYHGFACTLETGLRILSK
jgi:hypothetical protein